ncbi:MAG TPA: AbrB/MazE/SpoVT family DNA-binding domain-containing protein [Kiritimatiellia bacterium]|nr:AbrB/MazE/SpoVT family DNA-binding domain-containing protein [Kiritimatiellia bacterium]HMO98681.1 AbrB/MazE/SpoVT family DNA-binding domain-containing protein [Kiritimatiellia bacterium]HMP90825.1 AbrB/MazE/SpoVT family DNA-binding domain-containing protein [Kiritimatiellia bacterium]
MVTLITKITERGQASIPAEVRRLLGLRPGTKLLWEPVSENEVRVKVQGTGSVVGPMGVLGYAKTFRESRSTGEWMRELREGETI